MKLRIKGNTIRFRLTKPEVEYFGKELSISESTDFGNDTFRYSLSSTSENKITANFKNNHISIFIPEKIILKWVNTNNVGISEELNTGINKELFLLIEKDFKCLDETSEDQSDNYENPLAGRK